YSFYLLNQRADIRPPGWNLDNPLAPKVVTSDIASRYGATGVYQTGQAITPNMAPYWEVDITRANIQSLEQFNLLAIHTHTFIDLTRPERLLLRQYIDQGGTLWIDDCGTLGTYSEGAVSYNGCSFGNDFLFDAQFWNAHGSDGFGTIPNPTQRHPIITTPYFLSQDDLNSLGDKNISNYFITNGRGAPNKAGDTPSGLPPDPAVFTTVVGNSADNKLPCIAAGDYGSGHIVLSAVDIFDGINNPVDPPGNGQQPPAYSATNFTASPTQNLKVLVNIIAWAIGTASTDSVNNRREGQQLSMIDGGVSREWLYPDPQVTPAAVANYSGSLSAAAIFGNIAYVTDGLGTLHAFDLNPPESLSGVLSGDDGAAGNDPLTGLPYAQDFSQGTSYDELWSVQPAGNQRLSAPTVADLPGTGTCVFVEGDDNTVYVYQAGTALVPVGSYSRPGGTAPTPYSGLAPVPPYGLPPMPPAPSIYDGRLIAGQSDGTLLVCDLPGGNRFLLTLDIANVPPDNSAVIAPPAVASIPSRDNVYGGGDIVAYATTEQNVWAVLLGSRDEQVQAQPGQTSFQTKPQVASPTGITQGVFDLLNPPEDPVVGAGPGPGVYYNVSGWPQPGFVDPAYTPGTFTVSPTPPNSNAPPFYADYDITTSSTGNQSLSRTQIFEIIASMKSGAAGAGSATASGGVAVGPDNSIYLTVNEPATNTAYIEAVSEQSPNLGRPGNVIKWRFALVNTGPDAGGITYSLGGFQFVGAPVVDGNTVYALAQNAAGTPIVLAFNADAVCRVSAASGLPQPPSMTQNDETGATETIAGTQFSYDTTTGTITFGNFGPNGNASFQQISNLAAPLPVNLTTGGNAPVTNASTPMDTGANGGPLLRWWTIPLSASQVVVGPLRKIGNSVYFAANFTSNNQAVQQIVGVNTALGIQPNNTGANDRQIVIGQLNAAQKQSFVTFSTLGTGSLTLAPLAASGNFAVIQGAHGIEGFGYHPTLVADGSRLVSLGPSGNAIWSVDSSNQLQIQGGNLTDPEIGPATADQSGTVVASKVALDHPSSITQIGQDDYLVADTGNNRIVRLDTAGHVIWELTNFNDPAHLITPAATTSNPQSNALLSLNQPASALMWQTSTPLGTSPQVVIYHYLIADAGNFRVLEVDDRYTNGIIGNPAMDFHFLAWVSHTGDQAGRQYRYVSAQVVPGPGGAGYVLAGVSNVQVAPLVTSGANVVLAPPSQDSPGSSVLLLNYGTTGANGLPNGNGLPAAAVSQVVLSNAGTASLLPMRGLRSAQVYLPPNSGVGGNSLYQVVIADDDGAFSGPIGLVANPLATPLAGVTALPQA
ncbi:MAG TPA: hypothetical protein VFW40_02370, partial [Capsulimonadaceae bacterium]|nr:hypothetical protein [Capsulimonadaceae bacterium]